jgi:hypothetical protein
MLQGQVSSVVLICVDQVSSQLTPILYSGRFGGYTSFLCGETTMPRGSQFTEYQQHMGDKSPKSNQKKSTQKQTKANSVAQSKKQAIAAKQSAGKKK